MFNLILTHIKYSLIGAVVFSIAFLFLIHQLQKHIKIIKIFFKRKKITFSNIFLILFIFSFLFFLSLNIALNHEKSKQGKSDTSSKSQKITKKKKTKPSNALSKAGIKNIRKMNKKIFCKESYGNIRCSLENKTLKITTKNWRKDLRKIVYKLEKYKVSEVIIKTYNDNYSPFHYEVVTNFEKHNIKVRETNN